MEIRHSGMTMLGGCLVLWMSIFLDGLFYGLLAFRVVGLVDVHIYFNMENQLSNSLVMNLIK